MIYDIVKIGCGVRRGTGANSTRKINNWIIIIIIMREKGKQANANAKGITNIINIIIIN